MIRMRTTNGLGLGLFGLALALSLASTLTTGLNAASSTLIVNSADDVDDGACDAAHCSLREALGAANALLGSDTIAFDIPGQGLHTIRPQSPLPTVTDPVTIDGYTQPGAQANTNPPKLGTNARFGVLIGEPEGPRRNIVGGQGHDKGNVIAYNTLGGVRITRGDRNAVLTNAIFANGRLGIDLGDEGIEPNDPLDSDTGANQLQNYPVITAAISDLSGTTIKGTLDSLPDTMFRLEFYSSAVCDPFGNGEGETFLGHIYVTTDYVGNARFRVTSFGAVPVGHRITATATDSKGNTSEFSGCVRIGHQTQ